MALCSRIDSAIVSRTAPWSAFFDRPLPSLPSSVVARLSIASATIVLRTVSGNETDWLAPTARNSNLLPVKANGEVRFRSPAWRGSVGRTGVPSPRSPDFRLSVASPASTIWS